MNPLELYEAYSAVYAPQEVDEATAMAKRGYDEEPIRHKIAKSTGGGKSADRATALENKPVYGDMNKVNQRGRYARAQRGDFRKTASSNPGLHGYAHKSNDPEVKAKQTARGAQRSALTPKEKQQLNREEFDVFDVVLEFLYVEGYAKTLEEAEWMMANIIDEEAIAIVLGEENVNEIFGLGRKKGTSARADALMNSDYMKKKKKESDEKAIQNLRDMMSGDKKIQKRPSRINNEENVKEAFELWVNELVEEGYNLSDYTWDDMFDIYEADSLAAMQARREKRQKANMKKHGTPGFDYSKPPSGKKGYLDAITKKEEFVDEAMSSYDRNRQRAAQRAAARNAARKEGKTGAVPGVGYVSPRSERETYRDSAGVERHTSGARMPKNEEYVDESQYARENPEKYEREQAKKSAPVRGERTPMPPRGDKRREDFEKWYAKNVR
jgi:hypothetical protein